MKKLLLVVYSAALAIVFASASSAEAVYSESKSVRDLPLRPGCSAGMEVPRPIDIGRTHPSTSLAVPGVPDVEAVWVGAVRWMRGVNFSGDAFFGSIKLGEGFFGSSLGPNNYQPVEIVFSGTEVTLCQTYRRDLGYAASGVGTFPGYAVDVSDPLNPRRLNICFVEDNNAGNADLAWNPLATGNGGREYLFIMLSDYDGTGLTYAGQSIYYDAWSMDVQYGWWPQVEPGETFMSALPASLEITPHFVKGFRVIPGDGQLIMTWHYDEPGADEFCLYGGTASPPTTQIACVSASVSEWTESDLTNGVEYFYRVDVLNASNDLLETGPVLSATPGSVSDNVNLIGYWHRRGKYGDCWGYTEAGTGHEYGLICARDEGVSIIDIEASPLQEVGFIPSILPFNDAKDVKIYGHYAIVLKEYEPIQIVDISDVTAPVEVSQIQPDGTLGAHNCMVDGDYLYVVGGHGSGGGGLEIFDISTPALPGFVGEFHPFYYHDVDIHGNLLAGAGIYGDGVDLVDISNKATPVLVDRFNYTGSGAHNAEFSADGQTLFVGDEIGSAGNHTRVFDISEPSSVSLIYDIIVNPDAVTHNCYQRDGLLYIGHYTEGLRVWDIADPAAPFEIAYYDTFLPAEFGYQGAWSVYPYFASGKILISDMQTGLYVVELSGPTGCCDARVGDANGLGGDEPTIGDASVMIDAKFIAGTCDGILGCLTEADVNQSGGISPVCGDVTIGDISVLIDYLFITGPSLGLADCF